MTDDEKTRWAIEVVAASMRDEGGDLIRGRIDAYLDEDDAGSDGLVAGLINLSGLLLMSLEATTGKDSTQILQTIASTLAPDGRSRGS